MFNRSGPYSVVEGSEHKPKLDLVAAQGHIANPIQFLIQLYIKTQNIDLVPFRQSLCQPVDKGRGFKTAVEDYYFQGFFQGVNFSKTFFMETTSLRCDGVI